MTDKTNKQFQDSIVNNSRTDLFQAAQMAKGYFYEGQQYEGNQQYHNRSAKKQEASDFSDVRQNAEVIEPVKTTRRRTKNLPKEQTKVVESQNVQQEKPQHSQTQNQNGKGVRGRRKPKARRTRLDMEKEIQTLDDDQLKEQDQILLSRENKELTDDKDDGKNKKYDDVMLQNQAETEQPQEQINSPLSKNKKRLPSSKASSNQQIVFQPSSPHSEPEQQLYQQQDDTSSPNTSSPQRQPTGLFEESPKKSSTQSQPKEMTLQQKSIHLLKILTFPIKQNMVMKTNLIRVDGSLFGLHPQFHIYFQGDKTYLMSAKKVSRTPYSTFVISTDPKNFAENSQFYLGKAKCSVIGDQLDLYGPGLSPKDAYEKNKKPRQLLATVVYQTRILSSGQPRDFKVYIKNPQVDYYEDFPQIHMYEPQIPLHLLYQNPHNREKITVLQNRKPNYQQDIKGYSLNFKGRVGLASVKNFILEKAKQQVELQNDPQKNEVLDEIVIFGKANEKKYNMDVKMPLSPFMAFGIVLSSFDEKYFCE